MSKINLLSGFLSRFGFGLTSPCIGFGGEDRDHPVQSQQSLGPLQGLLIGDLLPEFFKINVLEFVDGMFAESHALRVSQLRNVGKKGNFCHLEKIADL